MATIKQRKALDMIVENGGNVSKGMRDAGYSPETASTPSKLTATKGWAELLAEYLPENDILKVHKEALSANKVVSSHTEPDYEVADHPVRLKAAELYYKLTAKLIDKAQIDGKLEVILTRE